MQLKLTDLNLGYNAIAGPIPSELGSLVHLKVLDLGHNNLTAHVPVQLGALQQLQVLSLRENLVSGSLPAGLLHNLTELRYVYLQQNALSGGA